MKLVELTNDGPSDISQFLEQARTEDLRVRLSDGSEFIVFAVAEDFDDEAVQMCRNEKLMRLLDARTAQSKSIPWEQVQRELGLK